MGNFNALYKPNQVITGSGKIAIVTGWTIKTQVSKRLDSKDYAVVGQLYSPTRGINFIIRNILANPHVNVLIALSATKEDENSGSVDCLIDFFRNGVYQEDNKWRIISDIEGYIDIEIPYDEIERVRDCVNCFRAGTVSDVENLVKYFSSINNSNSWGEPKTFPISEKTPQVLPGYIYGHRIEGKTIAETWVKIIHRIKTTGVIRPTGYDGFWQELIALVAIVTDEPDNFYFPEPNFLPIDRNFLESYIPQVVEDSPYVEGVKYTYGQRIRSWFGCDQVEQIVNKLVGEIDAASAVINLWDVKDHEKGGSPCLNHIWLRVVNNELSMTATFRSNDMFSAWCANAMGLRALQKHIRDEISRRSDYNLKLGHLITISQSAHIYDDCWENADSLISKYYGKLSGQEYNDPVGNFIIEIDNTENEIVVTQTTPGSGQVVKTFRGRNALKLSREIVSNSPGILPDHAIYLGIELQKASQSLRDSTRYRQD